MAELDLDKMLPSLITGTMLIDGGAIGGESLRANHEDEIDFHALRWTIAQQTSAQVGRGRTQGRAEVSAATVNKFYDASSPDLALACLQSKNFAEVVLTVTKDSGDEALEYLIITMNDVIVSNYRILGARPQSQQIEEEIGLTCQLITIKYTVQNEDYSAGDEFEMSFDIGAGVQA